ncbi:MAG: thioredoxin family protein [Fimbriimonas sp.]
MNDVPSQATQSAPSSPKPGRGKFNFWKWFWLSTIPFSLGLLWYDFYAPGNQVAWAKDYASAQQLSAKSGKPMVIFFSGKWCSPCKIMEREVWADREVETKVNAAFIPVMIDVDDPAVAALMPRYKVVFTPTTVITDPEGKVLQQVQGKLGKADFLLFLASPNVASAKLAR